MRVISDTRYQRQHTELALFSEMRLEQCVFDACAVSGGRIRHIELVGCRTWASSLSDLVVEDSLVDDLSTTVTGGGGRRPPLFLWGVRTKHLVLKGHIGSLIWNPPRDWLRPSPEQLDIYNGYYADVDWSLDVSEARFTSVPALRFGPPGRLIRRDPARQPLVARDRVLAADWGAIRSQVGIWRIAIEHMLASPWTDEIVLIPSEGDKRALERRGIEILRTAGVID